MEPLRARSSAPSTTTEEGLQHLDFATERARIMLGCYRKGEANDPQMYSTAVSALLAQYSQYVIEQVTHPMTGIPSKTDFMPTLKELKAACELEAQRENRINNTQPMRPMLKYDNSKKPTGSGFYELVETHGRPIGAFESPSDAWNKIGGGERQFVYGN
jgi:hypothetical protein